ncbi:MAG: ABC transporter substrate-binding protein, partial [Deltaproteobacteria bacterium]
MNKNLKIAIWILVVVLVAVTLIKTTYNKASSQVVRIGAVLPLTGGLADLGNAQKQGMQLAVKELNAKSKTKYELMIEDGKAEPKSSLDSANFLVSVKNAPIIITSFRGASLSVASGLEKSKVVILAHTATADGSPVTKNGSNFIPMGAEMTNAGRSVGIYAKSNANCSAIG